MCSFSVQARCAVNVDARAWHFAVGGIVTVVCVPVVALCRRSSPFARVKLGAQEYTTRTISRETNPVFNERFSFLCPVTPTMPTCYFSFHDRDK